MLVPVGRIKKKKKQNLCIAISISSCGTICEYILYVSDYICNSLFYQITSYSLKIPKYAR
jgi:hypothetical protein